ncbi:MAG: hypothetical protein ACI9N1_001906 [Flavobacteriales bacterium]|jgi:hypothetical protein
MNNKLYIISLLSVLFVLSCRKQEVGPQCPTCVSETPNSVEQVVIGCEGNFGWGNASISVYNPEEKTVSNSVYQSANGNLLGDVIQSFHLFDSVLFVVVNNASKIELINPSNYQSLGVITGFNSPRYMLGINNLKGYVTDLYSNSVHIIDPNVQQITGSINTNQWTERIYEFDSEVYICAPDTNWIFVMDPASDVITDTLFLSKGPNSMVQDLNGSLWALCTGGSAQEPAKLFQINPATKQTIQAFQFGDINDSPNHLILNSAKTQLIYMNADIYEMNILDSSLPTSPIINSASSIFYGMNINPFNDELYITDAIDYVQPGNVFRFDVNHQPIDTFQVGIIPQAIWFK